MVKDIWAIDWCELNSEEWIRLIRTNSKEEAIKLADDHLRDCTKGGVKIRLIRYRGEIISEVTKGIVCN